MHVLWKVRLRCTCMDTEIPGTTRNIGLLQLVHATSNELTSLIDQEKEEKKEGIKKPMQRWNNNKKKKQSFNFYFDKQRMFN